MFQCCFLNVEATPMNIHWLHFDFQSNNNVETTLDHRHWIDVILSTLFQRCFVNVKTTSTNTRRLNFHIQPNFNVETTLVHRRWIYLILSTLFQRCFANIETTSINVCRLNFHFKQIATLKCLLGSWFWIIWSGKWKVQIIIYEEVPHELLMLDCCYKNYKKIHMVEVSLSMSGGTNFTQWWSGHIYMKILNLTELTSFGFASFIVIDFIKNCLHINRVTIYRAKCLLIVILKVLPTSCFRQFKGA